MGKTIDGKKFALRLACLIAHNSACEVSQTGFRGIRFHVRDVQADEIRGFVQMKDKTRRAKGETEDGLGDAYTWVAMERDSKLVIAWHLGKREAKDALKVRFTLLTLANPVCQLCAKQAESL
jgi:hypothetical protein